MWRAGTSQTQPRPHTWTSTGDHVRPKRVAWAPRGRYKGQRVGETVPPSCPPHQETAMRLSCPVRCPRLLLIVLLALLVAGPPRALPQVSAPPASLPADEAKRQQQLRERDRLWAEAQQLRAQGKLAEALT